MLVPWWDQAPTLTWRDKIAYLTTRFLELPQTDCPVEHIYEPGVYIREMHIPAGTLFLGRAHLKGHEVELVSGSVIHVQPNGERVVREPPFKVMTVPGYQAVFYAITDVIGRTSHPNPEERRDSEALENEWFETLDNLKLAGEAVLRRLT